MNETGENVSRSRAASVGLIIFIIYVAVLALAAISELFDLTGIPMCLWLRDRVEIVPIISFRDSQIVINQPQWQALPLLRACCVLAVVGICIRVIVSLAKIAIREEFFLVIPLRKSHQAVDQGRPEGEVAHFG